MINVTARSILVIKSSLTTKSYATISTTLPNTLLLLEHRDDLIMPATLNAVTAAKSLGGTITGLIVGDANNTIKVVDIAKK